ncbi:MAG: tRNA (adenosine(37)-N6)-threonylcarbamoyltransferase complex ATPase subunit type 1 TsaE [Urechidicola sp.]|nr:tRNA (adenosine(37)-N6)-threonylcarbamoyltransferase complex ATPase subunit type 1 TsaE [Urechidicola sp.]
MKQNYSLKDLSGIAKEILATASSKVLLFNGDMGVGKTTLIKELVNQLGIQDIANSPTFSLVNEYQTNDGKKVYHFDFYRIESEEEAYDIGIEDYFYGDHWCFIEWGEKVKNLLPLEIVNINIVAITDNQRTIEID